MSACAFCGHTDGSHDAGCLAKPTMPHFQRHSETSRGAAIEMYWHGPGLRAQVLRFIAMQPDGATDDEVQEALDMNPSTQRPRRIELLEAGVIEDAGVTRLTRSGRRATVWRVKR